MVPLCLQEEEIMKSPWQESERLLNMSYGTICLLENCRNFDFVEIVTLKDKVQKQQLSADIQA